MPTPNTRLTRAQYCYILIDMIDFSEQKGITTMTEVTAPQAAEIVGIDHSTLFKHVQAGIVPARRVGLKRDIRIDVEDLRTYAGKLGYRFNEALATQYGK